MTNGYNGWTNRATWALNLHLQNNETDYRYFTDVAAGIVAAATANESDDIRGQNVADMAERLSVWLDAIYGHIESAATTPGEAVRRESWLMFVDVGTDASPSAINYHEIAGHWIDEAIEAAEADA